MFSHEDVQQNDPTGIMSKQTSALIWRSQILNAVVVGLTVIFTVLARDLGERPDEAEQRRVNL
jgi:hypothetical protein